MGCASHRHARPAIFASAALLTLASLLAGAAHATSSQEEKKLTPPELALYEDRIVTSEEVAALARPHGTNRFLWGLGWPFRMINNGMESGLIKFEKGKIYEKIFDFQRRMGDAGFRFLFGGLGEGSGMGVGTVYDYPPRQTSPALHLLGRMSFLSGYQEFASNFEVSPFTRSSLILLANYQWRPTEPYYGFGMESQASDRSSFALRQTSFATQWGVQPASRLGVGVEYTVAFLEGLGSTRGSQPSVEEVHGDPPGLDELTRLQSIGAFFDANFFRGENVLGGRAHVGASWQDGFGQQDIRYARVEGRIEGWLPIAPRRSALIAQAATELTREESGTDPVPFYLYPRLGGSATLRGFPLDRFYGRNMIFVTLEYRWAIHPTIQAQLFFDEGQIFQHTHDLNFENWHRNYGFGFRFRGRTATAFRIEFASSSEGFTVHISFGDRAERRLGGPVRYPLYRP